MFISRKNSAVEPANEEWEESDEEDAKDSTKLLKDNEEVSYERKLKSLEQESEKIDEEKAKEELTNNLNCLCCGTVMRSIKSTALFSLIRFVVRF